MINEILNDILDGIEVVLIEIVLKAVRWEDKHELLEKYVDDKTNDYKTWNCFGNRLILHDVKIKRSVKVIYLPMKEKNIRIDVAGKLPLYLNTIEKILDYTDNKRIENENKNI